MSRPTADIREILVLHLLQDEIRRELAAAQRHLQSSGIDIVDTKYSDLDVQVLFKSQGNIQNAVYMKSALDAEVRAKLRVMRVGRKKVLSNGIRGGSH
jgi:hypothetical protein